MAHLTRRYRMTIAYDGTDFHGWQKQKPETSSDEPVRTVAGVLELAMVRLLKQPINLVGASRTDAGVHARGQVAHFDATTSIPLERMAMAINSRLPDEVEVRDVELTVPTFNAIRDAVRKHYCYRIYNSQRRPLERRRYVWHCWEVLDVYRMNEAAQCLLGRHDFAAFAAAGHGRIDTVRAIHQCTVVRDASEIEIAVVGDGFLYNMVRIICGTLVAVGRGRFDPAAIDQILASKNRQQAGPTLPAQGLWLECIDYERDAGQTSTREARPPGQ